MVRTPATLAQAAAGAVHGLTVLTRPAITALTVSDLYTITSALAELTAALPQTLTQLSSYPDPDQCPISDDPAQRARTTLRHAAVAAGHLSAALQAAHQALGDLAEPDQTNQRGSIFNRR